MNGVLGFVLAVLVYPGVLVAFVAAWALNWARASARGAIAGSAPAGPMRDVAEIRSTFGRDTITPEGVHPAVLVLGSSLAIVCPLLALLLLPAPGNPLVGAVGLTGDLAAEGALLLGVPVARLLVAWAIPSPYTRLAADRGARLLAGAVVPMVLALTASAEQLTTLTLNIAPAKTALPTISLVTRILAALAFAVTLPALARMAALRESEGGLELAGGELGEVSGRDLACFRIGEALQLVAVAAVFAAVFLVPIFVTVPAGTGRALIWIVGMIVTAAGIGMWEGFTSQRSAPSRAPLSWWLEVPLLLSLVALVAAAWASRGQ
jgi:formate hydrogenlyase subunit 4